MPLSAAVPLWIGKPRSLLSQALTGSALGALLHVAPAMAQTATQPATPSPSSAQAASTYAPTTQARRPQLLPPGKTVTLSPDNDSTQGNASRSEPVTYLAEHESYDKTGLLFLRGNVRLWQGTQMLRADTVIYDRAAGTMTALHHVALKQADGTTFYADRLTFSHGLKDDASSALYIRMHDEAKISSSGMRRVNESVTELANAIYTACPVCAQHPNRQPFWQFKTQSITQDKQNQNLEFKNAWFRILGVPIIYFPYLAVTDPSSPRHSGFLNFNITPHDNFLGSYFTLPYYWAIDRHQDATFIPLVATGSGPQLSTIYRNRLNDGYLWLNGAIAYDTIRNQPFYNAFGELSDGGKAHGFQAYIISQGQFNLTPHWRVGFNANRVTAANYMRDYSLPGYGNDTLNTNAYLEGYGIGSYVRLDTQIYQGLNQGIISNDDLPYTLPRFTYEFQGQPDALGGRLSAHTTDFVVMRQKGINDQRGELALQWDRPWVNRWGQQWLFTARVDSMIYHATHMNQQPLFENSGSHVRGQVLPTAAVKLNWPFLRSFAKGHGTQVFEPIVQFIAAPNTGSSLHRQLPNEDSFAYEFSDTTLFALNRYMGTDRLDGGLRANVGLHQNWSWNGHSIDMLIGESFIEHPNRNQPAYLASSGVNHTFSDPVGRITFSPSRFFDLTARGRYNPYTKSFDYGEAVGTAGTPFLRVSAGYVYEPVTPYYYYYTPHYTQTNSAVLNNPYTSKVSEISGAVTARWRGAQAMVYTRRSLSRKETVATGTAFGYSNDCFTINIYIARQNTYIGGRTPGYYYGYSFTLRSLGTFGN